MNGNGNCLLRFYEIDLSRVGGEILYFHPGLNEFGQNVVWQGREYQPFPIVIEGIEYDGQGRLPRPTLTVSNLTGQVGNLIRPYNDLNGCLLTHRMTLGRFLDAANFKEGNPEANPALEFPKEIYIFERKAEETSEYIKFELTSALDVEGQKLPKRNYNANFCSHEYRGAMCGYSGSACFDTADREADHSKDRCGRRLSSCEARFGKGNELPFGGFPGVGLIAR
ncbi:MAG: phage minor tail protein L [Holophagaceae bacterium]|nr:phage minor tail protein L [Holophagaceae bacterium]